MKKFYVVFLVICCGLFIFYGCDNSSQKSLVFSRNGEYIYSINLDYEDVSTALDFEVELYNGKTSEIITDKCIFSVTNPNEESVDFNTFVSDVENNNPLDFGYWTIYVSYEEYAESLSIYVRKPINTNEYQLNLKSNIDSSLEQNSYVYGTKINGLNFEVLENETKLTEPDFDLYLLKSDVEFNDTLVPDYNILESVTFEELTPGKYYICAYVRCENYQDKFSSFQEITVLKSKIKVISDNLTLSYTFSSYYKHENVTFEDMKENYLLIQNAVIHICDDKNDENNLNPSYEKFTNEIYDDSFSFYGQFISVNNEVVYNSSPTPQEIELKFTPNESYKDIYEESESFTATITINKCDLNKPRFYYDCCENSHYYEPNKSHQLSCYIYDYQNLLEISTQNCVKSYDENGELYFTSNNIGEMKIEFKIISTKNFQWDSNNAYLNNVSYSLNEDRTIMTATSSINKGNLDFSDISISSVDEQQTLKLNDGKINLKIKANFNDEFLDGDWSWSVIPVGTIFNGTFVLTDAEVSSYENDLDNSKIKTLTINEDSTTSAQNYVVLYITLSMNNSQYWNNFNEYTFYVRIQK